MTHSDWRLYYPKFVIRFGGVAILALGLQLLVIYAGLGDLAFLRRVIFVVSYFLLVAFVAANWRRLGIAVIGLGLLLNLAAIVSNGGLMPVTPETLERAGLSERIAELEEGAPIPLSKDILLERGDTRLRALTDILVWNNPTGVNAFSIGDLIIGAGLVVTLGELLLPRLKRVSGQERSSDHQSVS